MLRIGYIAGVLSVVSLVTGCATTHRTHNGGAAFKASDRYAVDYGGRVNIRASDVPRFVLARYPRSRKTMSGPFGTTVERCAGIGLHAGDVVGVSSQSFHDVRRERSGGGGLLIYSVQSGVYVMSSSELVARDVMAAVSARGRQCLTEALVSGSPSLVSNGTKVRELLGSSGSKRIGSSGAKTSEGAESREAMLSNVKVSRVDLRMLGTSVYGLRTVAHTAIAEGKAGGAPNYYQNTFAFTVGRAVIRLSAVGSPRPFSRREERRLLALLYRRATKAS